MEKKKYLSPEVKVHSIKCTQMICGSTKDVNFDNGNGQPATIEGDEWSM